MKGKKIVSLLLTIVLVLFQFNMVFASSPSGQWIQAYQDYSMAITFNGVKQGFTDPADGSKIVPIVYNGRSYLPVRAICNLSRLDVVYDTNTHAILLSKGSNIIYGDTVEQTWSMPKDNGKWIQAYQDSSLVVKFDGNAQTFTDQNDGSTIVPIVYNNRSYLPVRAIANLAGLNMLTIMISLKK